MCSEKEVNEPVVLVDQQHSNVLVPGWRAVRGHVVADGITINKHDSLTIGVYTSDCLPLVLLGEEFAAVLHISRKSVANGILQVAAKAMEISKVRSVYLGPHICADHFYFEEMREDLKLLYRMYPNSFAKKNDVWHVSLRTVVLSWLDSGRHMPEVIFDTRCTFEDSRLPSYRRGAMGTAANKTRLITTIRSLK